MAKKSGIPLKIAGEVQPIFQDYFDTMIKPHIDGKFIEYVGEVDLAAKNELLGNSLAMLFPIQWDEPFGLVMIEAMACGTPVLALPGGSVEEVVRDGISGFVCQTPDEMAQRAPRPAARPSSPPRCASIASNIFRWSEWWPTTWLCIRRWSAKTARWAKPRPRSRWWPERVTQRAGMSTYLTIPDEQLVEIPSPHLEPRLAFQALEPRKVDNLTLIDGKTFSATNVAGDIYPPGSPDVGFFHDDTRFLSHLELRIGGHRTVVLSSSTEKTFSSQIELTTGNITLRDSFDLPENTVHIRREQLLASEIFFDRMTFENFNLTPVDFTVEMLFDADFVDVFQVRGVARQEHGQYYQPVVTENSIAFYYRGLDDVMRQTLVKLSPAARRRFRSASRAGSCGWSR